MKKSKTLPVLLCDYYKLAHRVQYPKGTSFVYDNFIPRKSLLSGIDKVVVYGLQAYIQEYLVEYFNEEFFNKDISEITIPYTRTIKHTLFVDEVDTKHIEELHELGYLPIEIKAIPEGTLVPLGTPILTLENTDKRFFWLPGFLETQLSSELWQPATAATIAREYKKILNGFADETVGNREHVPFQAHDFSFRGMEGVAGATKSGMGHLTSFVGTDSIPSIDGMEYYYQADIEKELVGTSIPATEHSVMCAHGQDELETFRTLITDVYPAGFVSIVSDTWDFWNVVGTVLPKLKKDIMARDGKVVIRPDSGVPEDIVCGSIKTVFATLNDLFKANFKGKAYIQEAGQYVIVDEWGADEYTPTLEEQGLVASLFDLFGGTTNSLGFKELDSHIGAIYGDSITLARCEEICRRLKEKGFASSNIVFGVGSFSYQYTTRDSLGFAMKATWTEVNGEEKMIFKAPKTDSSKNSLRGRVVVYNENGEIKYRDGLLKATEKEFEKEVDSLFETVFLNGEVKKTYPLSEIRQRIEESI